MRTFKTSLSLLIACVLLLTTACSSDDGGQTTAPETNDHGVEVCIVFAPKDMGDQGYAERVLDGMFLLTSSVRHPASLHPQSTHPSNR